MKFLLKPTDPEKIETDTLIVFCFEDSINDLSFFDQKLTGLLKISAQKENFTGKEKQQLVISTIDKLAAYKLLVIGLGKKEEFDLSVLRQAVARAVKTVNKMKIRSTALVTDDFWLQKYPEREIGIAIVEAVSLSSYRFHKYKGEEEKKQVVPLDEVIIQVKPSKISQVNEGVEEGKILSEATCFARDLVNEPAAVTTPSFLASVATRIAKESKGIIKARIFEKEEVEKLGMGAYLGVARGSEEPLKFIRLIYKPARFNKKVVIVGKGITFDTGGLSIKSSEQMETMKSDMAGAAAVLAIFEALKTIEIGHQVVGIIPACENMLSGKALRPGDVLTAVNGKTIEVLNTDAEGRLTLADAFAFAVKWEKPDYLIDLATLTGACRVALGEELAGLWSNDTKLTEKLQEAAIKTGEKLWQMPLFKEYKELLKSHIADIRNISTGRYGGAITAALFLSEFVNNISWAHLDIAGPSYVEKSTPLTPIGGSGFGVRILLHFLKEL